MKQVNCVDAFLLITISICFYQTFKLRSWNAKNAK